MIQEQLAHLPEFLPGYRPFPLAQELPKGLPLAAGVLVLCMVLQCIRLAARSEYIAEA